MAAIKAARSASDRDGPKSARSTGEFSEPWMARFLYDAYASFDVMSTCRKHDVSLTDLRAYRARDPAFARALDDLDRELEAAVVANLRAAAAKGDDLRATSLYLRRKGELAALGAAAGPQHPPEVAAAMIAAMLLAYHRLDPTNHPRPLLEGESCPACGQAVPRPPRPPSEALPALPRYAPRPE